MGTSGGPGKIDSLNYGDQLESMAIRNARRGGKLYRTAMPLYQELVGQTLEGLRTGGVNAQIPIIQRAVEQSKIAGSNATAQATEGLRGAGLAGTPFGQSIINDTRTAGALQTSRIPSEVVQGFIGGAPGLSAQGFSAGSNYSNLGANILGNLQNMDLSRQMANAAQFQHFMSALYGGVSQGLGSASMGCLHPDTPIETPSGDVRVSSLRTGDSVISVDRTGMRMIGRVAAVATRDVSDQHVFARIEAPRGVALISPSHPRLDGSSIVRHPDRVPTATGVSTRTMDLLVDSPTGAYFVLGLALGSTLDARHRRAA